MKQVINGYYKGVKVESRVIKGNDIVYGTFPNGQMINVTGPERLGSLYQKLQDKIDIALAKPTIQRYVLETNIVGVTFDNYDGVNRQDLLKLLYPGIKITLRKNPNNTFDKNAIEVMSEFGCVGHLSRTDAQNLSGNVSLEAGCVTSLKLVENGSITCLITFTYQIRNRLDTHSGRNLNTFESIDTQSEYNYSGDEYEVPTIDSPPEVPYDDYQEECLSVMRDGSPY